jgi:release factor glutamine methyltransferase
LTDIPTITQLLAEVRVRLNGTTTTPSLDGQVLLASRMGVTRGWLLAHGERHPTPDQYTQITEGLNRIYQGEALPYVLGHWEFYGRRFNLTPQVLIPRPETELLIETALDFLQASPWITKALDIGTGSGCVAVTLAAENERLAVTAGDVSPAALQVAKANAILHKVDQRMNFIQMDLLSALTGSFDLVCANLPYIPSAELAQLLVARREPILALDGGRDGLDLNSGLIHSFPEKLAPGGMALLEIEAGQGSIVGGMAKSLLPRAEIKVLPDFAGHDRLVSIVREKES